MYVEHLGKQFGLSCLKKDNETICPFPPAKGSGYFRSSKFPNGIEVIEINGILTKPLHVPIIIDNDFVVRMVFNTRWSAIYNDAKGEKHGLDQFDSILTTQKKVQECSYDLTTDGPISLFIVELNIANFRQKFSIKNFEEEDEILPLLDNLKEHDYFLSKDNYLLSAHDLILKFNKTGYTGKMRYVYQEAKITEIIVGRFKQLLDDLGSDERSIKRKSTIHSIEQAAISISKQLDNIGTIEELARSAGMSQQRFQAGFKQVFGSTVNQFVADLRLNRAIELLDNTDLNMSEITYKLGLNSRSYFSKIFKEKFGIAPNEYKKNIKTSQKIEFRNIG